MLIDCNAYIGHWPFRIRKYGSCAALLSRMNQFGVDLAVVSSLSACFYKNTQTANQALFDEIHSQRTFRDRFSFLAVINPIYGGWRDDLETCHRKFGIRGIKLYPKYHGYDPAGPECTDLIKMARDRDLVIAFSLRMVDSRPSSWLDIDEEWDLKDLIPVIRKVSDARYLIQNVSNRTDLEDGDSQVLRDASVAMDTSGRSMTNLGSMIETYGPGKFVFGTHSPVLDYCTGLLRIESLRQEEGDETVKEQIRSGNARQLFNL